MCLQQKVRINVPENNEYNGYQTASHLYSKLHHCWAYKEKKITMYTLSMNFKDNIEILRFCN